METQTINGVEIIRGLDIEAYHKAPHLSSSKIMYWLGGSPERWKAKFVDGKRVEEGEEPHFTVGRAVDTLLFDGQKVYSSLYCVAPATYPSYAKLTKKQEEAGVQPEIEAHKPWNMQANYCKEWAAEQETAGKTILTTTQNRLIGAMAVAVARQCARDILRAKGAETQVTFRYQIDGIWVQARPDVVNMDAWTWDDLKSTRSLAAVGKNFIFHGYDMQAGLVFEALRRIRGGAPARGRHIYVDKTFYPSTDVLDIYGGTVGPEYVEYGLQRAIKAIKAIDRARQTGIWTTPQTAPRPLIVPSWIQAKIVEGEELSQDEFLETDDEAEDVKLQF